MSQMKMTLYEYCLTNDKHELLNEWDKEKNEELTPQNVSFKSSKKVWWQCREGHEWQAVINNRTNGTNCPYCARRRMAKGFNNLATVAPEIAAQWHPTKNGDLTPDIITAKSREKVWWQCVEGHEWQAIVYNRTNGTGCPYCAGQRVIKGVNDLATIAPEIAAQWHPSKNGDLTPDTITAKSEKKVWWQCKEGHEWQAVVSNRTNRKGCPYCAGRRVIKGVNDLATVAPEVAAQWHPSKNGDLTPETTFPQSNIRVWWQCKEGHEWQAIVYNRTNGAGCPYCAQIKGFNNLATVAPEVAAQWHPTLNKNLTPETITPKSGKKVWWKCTEGHEWEAIVKNRTNGAGCPVCYSINRQRRKILTETKKKVDMKD